MSKTSFVLMGCGASAGVPTIGNYWGSCNPNEPKNIRTRSSAFIQTDSTTVLIDTGPDFREQCNKYEIQNIDAVLYTHSHADHTHGIQELSILRRMQGKRVPIYTNENTLADLKHQFSFMFDNQHSHLYPSALEDNIIMPYEPFTIGDIDIMPIEQDHGTMKTLGFRVGDLAYSTDMKNLDDQALKKLKGIKTWVVDAGAYHNADNYVHAHIGKVYELNEKVGAEKVFIMHLPATMDYQTVQAELKDGYQMAYDGLKLIFIMHNVT